MSDDAAARRKAKAAVQAIFDVFHYLADQKDFDTYDRRLMTDAKILDAGPEGSVVFELTVSSFYSNLNGVVHGGAYGVIFDMLTTTALGPLARPGYWDFYGGVTRALNISYLRAVPVGTTVQIRSHVVQVGRTMALIRGVMVSPDGKTTYATADHHKVNVPAQDDHVLAMKVVEEKKKNEAKM